MTRRKTRVENEAPPLVRDIRGDDTLQLTGIDEVCLQMWLLWSFYGGRNVLTWEKPVSKNLVDSDIEITASGNSV